MNTGNSVLDYRVTRTDCDFCHGRGYFWTGNFHEAEQIRTREIVGKFYDSDFVKTFGEIKALWKELKKSGEVECPDCSGKGYNEVWI